MQKFRPVADPTRYDDICFLPLKTAAIFYAFGIWLKQDRVPAFWIMQMIGCGIAVFGVTEFLLEDIRGRYREVYVDDEEASSG